MNLLLENIKTAYGADAETSDRGDIVQTILIVAGFALVTILAINWIGTTILNKGADVAECIEGSNTYNNDSGEACTSNKNSKDKSVTKEKTFKDRYGN